MSDFLSAHLFDLVTLLFSGVSTVFLVGRKTGALDVRVTRLESDYKEFQREIREDLREIRADVKALLSHSNR